MNKRRKLSLSTRMSVDHSRGYYLTQCRDLVEEKKPGQVWLVQSSVGNSGQEYTVTRSAAPKNCATSCCDECDTCPHRFTCTCPRYENEDVHSCKHTHAINQILLQKPGAEEDSEDDEEEEDEIDNGDYPDFSQPVGFRQFELRFKNAKSLFINVHTLADLSPRFAELCFDGPVAKQQVTIDDETYEDLLELMRCVFPCSTRTFQCKPVTIQNLAKLARLSHKYQIAQLKCHCERFIKISFVRKQAKPKTVFHIVTAVANAEFSKEAIATVVGRAATFEMQLLKRAKLADNVNPKVWSALLEAKKRYRVSESRQPVTITVQGHRFLVDSAGTPRVDRVPFRRGESFDEYCDEHNRPMCDQATCLNCSNKFCMDDEDNEGNDQEYGIIGDIEDCTQPERYPVPTARVNIALLN